MPTQLVTLPALAPSSYASNDTSRRHQGNRMTRRDEAVRTKVEEAQAQLEAQLLALETSQDWMRTLERMAILGPLGVSRFSFNNLLLLAAQRPDIRHAATFNAWHQRGRRVKKGEKGLTVLRPRVVRVHETDLEGETVERSKLAGFSYLTVFALEQTEGDALPEPVRPRSIETPEGFRWTISTLEGLLRGIPGVAGITLRRRGPQDNPRAAGWFELATHRIVVIDGESSPAQMTKTLLHEVAHAVLHGDGEHHETPVAEVEAESTAFVVAQALELDTTSYSLPYVATWALAGDSKRPARTVSAVGERIRRAAGVILAAILPTDSDGVDRADSSEGGEALESAA